MKNTNFIFLILFLFMYSCDDTPDTQIVPILDGVDFTMSKSSSIYPGEKLTLIANVVDNDIDVEFGWIIEGKNYYGGDTIQVSFAAPSVHTIELWADDGINDRISETKTIEVMDFPNVALIIESIECGRNMGDGSNKTGEIYVLSQVVSSNDRLPNIVSSTAYPNTPDKETPMKLDANKNYIFNRDSGPILFEGVVGERLAFNITLVDYDKKKKNWGKIMSKIFGAASTILKPIKPEAAAIAKGLSEVSGVVGGLIKETDDDIVSRFSQILTVDNYWNLNESVRIEDPISGVAITYKIKLID